MATADSLQTNLKLKFSVFDPHSVSSSLEPKRALFEDVRAMGRINFESYITPIGVENNQKPWRSTMKTRALLLSELGKRCLETRQNEMEWRLKVEHHVTIRFDIEFNCKTCRAKVWRTEKDPTIATNFRAPGRTCECKPRHKDDNVDNGLSQIFDSHAGTTLKYAECIPSAHRKHPQTDRIYGLRKTDRIRRILQETLTQDDTPIGEEVKSTPFESKYEQLHFPFFVSEAKAERAEGGHSTAGDQSACAIITCLELQGQLANAVRSFKPEDESLKQEPLVWFLSNKGEHWHVSIASFNQDSRSAIKYQVERLWSGSIDDPEAALRLLLIMDYAFDWARDVYRRNIIDQLLALAANPTATLAADTDARTVLGNQQCEVWNNYNFMEDRSPREVLDNRHPNVLGLFEMFDIDEPIPAVLRDARYMIHDVIGLDITPDNFEELVETSSKDSEKGRALARKIQRASCNEHVWAISAETLDAIEFMWSGVDREHQDLRDNDAKFLVNFVVSSHLKGPVTKNREGQSRKMGWLQTHTLKFVAVAETAVELLKKESQFAKDPGMYVLEVTKDTALAFFRKIRHATVRQCLAAALSSVQRMTSHDFKGRVMLLGTQNVPTLDDVAKNHPTSELPFEVYNNVRTGRTEPKHSFLRLSSSPFQEQIARENDANQWLKATRLISEDDYVVFAYADMNAPSRRQERCRSHCIFLVDPTHPIGLHNDNSSSMVMSAQGAGDGEQPPQAQDQPAIFRVSSSPSVRRSLDNADDNFPENPVQVRDFDWFVDHINNEWQRLNEFIRKREQGYYISGFENLSHKIKLLYGPEQPVDNVVPILVGIGMSLKLRILIKYLSAITTSAAELLDEDRPVDKGKAPATVQEPMPSSALADRERRSDTTIDSPLQQSGHFKRYADTDTFDQPGPSKRSHLYELQLTPSKDPRSGQARPSFTTDDNTRDTDPISTLPIPSGITDLDMLEEDHIAREDFKLRWAKSWTNDRSET